MGCSSSATDRDTPLIPGRVYGLRSWAVAARDGKDGLEAPFTGVRWPADGYAIEARCLAFADHEPPSADCTCGIYAYHPSADSVRELYWELRKDYRDPAGARAIGIVEAWGSVEVHDTGFRAEYARPYALVIFERLEKTDYGRRIEQLAGAYGADLVQVRDPEALRRHCVEHDLGLSEQGVAGVLGPEFVKRRRRTRRVGRIELVANASLAAVLVLMLTLYVYAAIVFSVWD